VGSVMRGNSLIAEPFNLLTGHYVHVRTRLALLKWVFSELLV
jgi:hypothetical protein